MNEVQPLKKYPKLVQVDARGQIVIPKDMRAELGIENGTGFWMFSIEKEGILLKKVDEPSFDETEFNCLDLIDVLQRTFEI